MLADELAEQAEVVLWGRAVAYIEQSFLFQMLIKVGLVLLGTTMAGLAQLPVPLNDTGKAILGITGVALAAVGGIVLVLVDGSHIPLMQDFRETLNKWKASLREQERLGAECQRLDADLTKANELMVNFDGMMVLLETTLALEVATLKERLDRFVGPAAPGLIAVMELGGAHNWTLSIFHKQLRDGEQRMVRLSSNWMDREEQDRDVRSWRRGKGWTGEAWRRGEEHSSDFAVVERDAATPDAKARYDTDGQTEPLDDTRYRSVAAVPFRDSRSGEVIGVVTATSSRVGAFDVDRVRSGRRNLDTVKSFALLAALIVSAHTGR